MCALFDTPSACHLKDGCLHKWIWQDASMLLKSILAVVEAILA